MEAFSKILILLALINASALTTANIARVLTTGLSDQRTTRTECNSYSRLTERLSDEMVDTISDIASRIYKPKTVLKSALVEVLQESCQVLARKADQIKKDCANDYMFLANMHVLGGICTDKGSFTALTNDLLDGYKYVVSACIPSMHPIMAGCPREDIAVDKGMAAGQLDYRRIMPGHLHCVFTGIDNSDGIPLCGETPSLKRMAVLFELLTYPGPGVTFTLANFEL